MFKLKECYKNILPLINEFSGDISFSIKNVHSDEKINYQEAIVFPTASTIKIFILGNLLSEIDKGNYSLTDYIKMTTDQQAGGTGVLKEFKAGTYYTIYDIAIAMTILSDNTATNMIIDLLGGVSTVNNYIEDLGYTHTKITNRADVEVLNKDASYFTVGTTEEFTQYLTLIQQNKAFSKESTLIFFKIMSKQQDLTQFPRYLPYNPYGAESNISQDVSIANKTGTYIGIRGDVGLVKIFDEEIIFSILTKDSKDSGFNIENEGSILIGKIGKEIYNCIIDKT